MTEQTFHTPGPILLHVEFESGDAQITAEATDQTTVHVDGPEADQFEITHEDGRVSVRGPRRRMSFGRGHEHRVTVTFPERSDLRVETGSADISLHGPVGVTDIKTGSGDIDVERLTAEAELTTGSGDIEVEYAEAELRLKTGSGDISVSQADGAAALVTGSGDINVQRIDGRTDAKTGSGDILIGAAGDDVRMSSGTGDQTVGRAHRGRIQAKSGSADITVGVVAGTPVWTDINTVSGSIRSQLTPTGAPAEGAEHLEIRATTASGDVTLREV